MPLTKQQSFFQPIVQAKIAQWNYREKLIFWQISSYLLFESLTLTQLFRSSLSNQSFSESHSLYGQTLSSLMTILIPNESRLLWILSYRTHQFNFTFTRSVYSFSRRLKSGITPQNQTQLSFLYWRTEGRPNNLLRVSLSNVIISLLQEEWLGKLRKFSNHVKEILRCYPLIVIKT